MFNNVTLIGYLASDAESRSHPQQLDPDGPLPHDQAYLEEQ
jgi:hypothetical protein